MGKVFDNKYVDSPHFPLAAIAVLACYAMYVLVGQHSDYLYALQDFSPWMGTSDFFNQFIGHPGGLREWLGCFLTQFFYYPWLGALMLVLCWSLSAWMFVKSFKLSGLWSLMALVPEIALLSSITDLGYWIFCLKTVSYWFGPSLGLLMVSAILYGFSRLGINGRIVLVSATVLLGYPAMGWMATLAIACMVVMAALDKSIILCVRLGVALMVSAILVGIYYYHSSAVQWRAACLMYGFPEFVNADAECVLFEVPFWILSVIIVLFPIVSLVRGNKRLSLLPVVLVLLALGGSVMFNYGNLNFNSELRMIRAMDDSRWDDVLSELSVASESKKPTREMIMMKNVALAQKCMLGQSLFDYPVSGVRPAMNTPLPIHMAHSAAPLFYYWLGIPNFAFVWCMENNIEFGLSPFYLRLMYRCMLVNGEMPTARKYKRLLETTTFWNEFAVDESEIANVRRFITDHNDLNFDGGISERYLLIRLPQEQYETPEAQEIAVAFSILSRNSARFIETLSHYKSLLAAQGRDTINLPKYFNNKSFEWYYESNTGNKSY